MLSLITRKPATVERAPADLAVQLLWLQGFGQPWLHATKAGKWVASVDMHTNAAGAKFEIRTEHLDSPHEAVDQVIERVRAALEQQR